MLAREGGNRVLLSFPLFTSERWKVFRRLGVQASRMRGELREENYTEYDEGGLDING